MFSGLAVEEAVHDTGIPCPIHGGLGPWVDVGVCEGFCGMGTQKRVRVCDSPLPQFGGNPCMGELELFNPCETAIPCPLNGHWGHWHEFSMCSVNCGVGVMHRKRVCDNPSPSHGGLMCMGPALEELPCDTRISCPINGQWSSWSVFKPCSVPCGIGLTQRIRECNNPLPLFGGLECLGSPVDTQECNTNIPCPVHGGWGRWTDFGVCSAKCGVGISKRTRVCNNPPPMNGGALCFGFSIHHQPCNTGLSCPVDGYWSHWLPWSQCSSNCGVGVRQRYRLCNNPIPDFSGLNCIGEPFQEQPCDTGMHCIVDGGWSAWSPPLPCPVTCGVGTTRRVRECNSPLPMFGGAGCFGPSFEVLKCSVGNACPQNGGWSIWMDWSMCGSSCGVSVQQRFRYCHSPPPAFGGVPCQGPAIDERPCDTGVHCPIPGGWSGWTDVNGCSAKCGVGVAVRKRFCNTPLPQFGGPMCIGPDVEETNCNTGVPCPIHGAWSPWADLSSCSVACGVGVMRRSRECNYPAPMFGGLPCPGPAFVDLPCDTRIPCPVNGNWGPWNKYSPCSVNCGVGVMIRKRECNAPLPMFGGFPCVGPAFDESPCDTGLHCPIDGGWFPWSAFSPCGVPCGIGLIRRFRECKNPAPMFGGLTCIGFNVDENICDTGRPCPIEGNWGPWTPFSGCSTTCDIGIQRRTRLCNNPPPIHGGGFCLGSPLEEIKCDTGVQCPLHGGWTSWSIVGPCQTTCGMGVKRRLRECANPKPLFGGDMCLGPGVEEMPCESGIICPINGAWTLWSRWSGCSAACGTGMSIRRRECADPVPLYGGLPCVGPNMHEMVCETGLHCPIDGGWGPWKEYMPCSARCGMGVTQRIRMCNSPPPQYGGMFCIGEAVHTKHCDTGLSCPIDGGFSLWSQWSVCMGQCGDGLQFRERICNSPFPMHGGLPCTGIFKEERTCDTGQFCSIHGGWGEWSGVSVCSATCGVGVQERTRLCDMPIPMYGGLPCVGPDVNVMPCDSGVFCPIPGDWNMWSPWSVCSAKCSIGVQFRERSCSNPPPQHGGPPCVGVDQQEQVCDTGVLCPVNGGWSFWTDWLPCNVKCGVGIQSRKRVCNSPPPQFGGVPCIGPEFEDTMCDTGIPCPIDGHWNHWSQWSLCTASCGLGLQQRVRECTNPIPLYGGNPCVGRPEQVRDCDTGILCPIDGFWTPWSVWTPCSVPCGVGIQGRARACTNPPPIAGGRFCDGPVAEKLECDTGIPCPIQGNWSPWSLFSNCDAVCGTGVQVRSRACTNPPPQFGGDLCLGFAAEKIPCEATIPCPIDGGWSLWTQFGPCIGQCGIGHQERARTCTNPIPRFGGMPCNGPNVEVLECDTGIGCPIHGGWSPWLPWSMCQADCGLGMRERHRGCNHPPPQFGGMPCEGFDIETGPCDTGVHCPVHGGWSLWSPPTPCSSACGVGIQSRVRSCTNPVPQFGGLVCVGPSKKVTDCDTGIHCPIHGQWGPWASFGTCNVKCGVGIHVRTRFCDSPPPQFGGFMCEGPGFEETKCDTGFPCVAPGWSLWSPWSGCKTSCGIGEQIRVRECPARTPADRVLLCHGPDIELLKCVTGNSITLASKKQFNIFKTQYASIKPN